MSSLGMEQLALSKIYDLTEILRGKVEIVFYGPVTGPLKIRHYHVYHPGFCVICELEQPCVVAHLQSERHSRATYRVYAFQGRSIVAPRGTLLNGARCELATCDTCSGVFYKHRVHNHLCGHPGGRTIYEGTGVQFCLLCQLRCENVREHARDVHHSNPRQKIATVYALKMLMPDNIDLAKDVDVHEQCVCGSCLRVTFKNRKRRVCPHDVMVEIDARSEKTQEPRETEEKQKKQKTQNGKKAMPLKFKIDI